MSERVRVIGAGSWGTALAMLLAENGHSVSLWARTTKQREEIRRTQFNQPYLPGIRFDKRIEIIDSMQQGISHCACLVLAVPMKGMQEVLTSIKGTVAEHTVLCVTCKGLDSESQLLPHELVSQLIPTQPIAILSGPSFAREVAQRSPSAVAIASESKATAAYVSGLFHNKRFRTYTNEDMTGVAFAGALKNVLAIAAGISDGLGYGANARAALITRGLAEISRLGMALGGRFETFMGLAGIGDIMLSCTDDQSRNRTMGLLLAKGQSVAEIKAGIGQVIEGVNTAEQVVKIAKKNNLEMPIAEAVLAVIKKDITAVKAVQNLLSREPKSE